ncbi:isocitrate dehydrogenase kinase/phosphatase AceK regulatory subunit, partial [Klebsiella michiganensis]|uniref:isocitrate dehydrogenase kinase/phosphatase AceK regulatory subunit n=1 Tax=Klebsiella michiganensis TaxID=1134687 RepID=UPI00396A734A
MTEGTIKTSKYEIIAIFREEMTRGLELLIAQTILQGFDAQYGRFLEVTSGAQQRFEQAD